MTIFIISASVGACATFATGETKLQAIKTVGIISAIGGEMSFARAGLTGANNEPSQSVPIGSWGMDDLIVQLVSTALNNRFQVQPVGYNRVAFAEIKDSPVTPVNFFRVDPFKKLVETEVSPQGLDAYIVITKAKSNFGGGARKVDGIGFATYTTALESYNQVFALYEIRVFDGKTFGVIERMAAQPLDNAGAVKLTGPSRMTDENFWPVAGDPAPNEKLHGAITDLVRRSLASTLSDMHLADVR